MMGLKDEQKHLLYDNAGKVAALAFSGRTATRAWSSTQRGRVHPGEPSRW